MYASPAIPWLALAHAAARGANLDAMLALIGVLSEQLTTIDAELRDRARSDPRLNAPGSKRAASV
jgi:hypothetical protein